MSDPVVGVDMAKAEFVVACRPEGTRWTATNDPEGVAATVARLRTVAPALIVAEAMGGYERARVAALAAAGQPLVVANPRQGRDCARALGLYEEAPHDSQRDDADQHDLAEDESIRVRLTFKTVATVTTGACHGNSGIRAVSSVVSA
jgi:transposase